MQGEKISSLEGRVTGRRVIANAGSGPKVETSFEDSGQMLGIGMREMGTYESVMRPDGSLFGVGQGVLMGQGGEMASWTGQGVGALKPDGSVTYRGAIYYQSSSTAWSRLNSLVGIFEYDVDAQGNTKSQIWEWK